MLMLTCKHPHSQTCEHRSGNVAIIGQGFEIHLLALEGDLFRVYLSVTPQPNNAIWFAVLQEHHHNCRHNLHSGSLRKQLER